MRGKTHKTQWIIIIFPLLKWPFTGFYGSSPFSDTPTSPFSVALLAASCRTLSSPARVALDALHSEPPRHTAVQHGFGDNKWMVYPRLLPTQDTPRIPYRIHQVGGEIFMMYFFEVNLGESHDQFPDTCRYHLAIIPHRIHVCYIW